eukprot:scaffold7453_cov128-Isochrysis_galbana.AAC.10
MRSLWGIIGGDDGSLIAASDQKAKHLLEPVRIARNVCEWGGLHQQRHAPARVLVQGRHLLASSSCQHWHRMPTSRDRHECGRCGPRPSQKEREESSEEREKYHRPSRVGAARRANKKTRPILFASAHFERTPIANRQSNFPKSQTNQL